MNWQQLQHFEKLVSVGHYRKAAEQLYITQPTLSKSISNLEKELGVPLFYKKNNDLYLTIYGKAFHSHVQNAISEPTGNSRAFRSEYRKHQDRLYIYNCF